MFERFLHQTPFFRLLVPFILGIIFQIKVDLISQINLYILLILFVITILWVALRLTRNFTLNKVWGVIISFLLFSAGAQLVIMKQQKETCFDNSPQTFIATVVEQPQEKEKTVKTTLKLNYIKDSTGWKNGSSLLLCYFQKDSATLNLQFGDQVITQTYINEIKHTGNPYAFNYKKYLKFKEIYNQCYIQSNQFNVIAHNEGSRIKILSNKTRHYLLNIYKDNHIEGDEFAVLSALTLGYKSELTPELKESFSTSGAMHVLAVSGLHVGIIYIILCKLLFFLQKSKYGKFIQALIIIAVLFFYAFLTGLSDSIFRATLMFTLISIGNMFTRQINIYNSIAASAFILLFINPYSVMSVGFQLSYVAVISIVFFQPKIYNLLSFNNRVSDYTWQLVSVAIAAQIGTFPITIHYFNQFPVYFIITNIIIIPLATLIIYSAFALILLSFSDFISTIVAKMVYALTWLLNHSINFIESLPGSNLEGIVIDTNQVFILVSSILIMSFFIISKRYKYLQYSLLILVTFSTYNLALYKVNSNKSFFTIHHISGMSAFHFIDHNKAYFLCDQGVDPNDRNIVYNVYPVWEKFKIDKSGITYKHLDTLSNFFTFKNKRFIQLKDNFLTRYNPRQKLKTDYLILSDNINISIKELTKYFDFNMIIFDTSNSYYTVKNWEKECKQNNIDYYNVLNNGALTQYL